MKEIKDDNKVWTMRVTCTGTGRNSGGLPCGKQYEIEEADLVVKTAYIMRTHAVNCIGFICPHCGSFTEINGRYIPSVIWNRCIIKHMNELEEQRRQEKSKGIFERFRRCLFGSD